ncbi:hypothetical protein KIN20_012019 [Parelaphostrongylus tenuis]|uniref:Uncharacterized protein n=1 Tax=Parelaphostrongylus tenuis TaxID=148309 RepID=A0AAD5QMX8_PARTN|nr:hypothetical protein KIN20_012019 [Parelaphostrongylus tenuis]
MQGDKIDTCVIASNTVTEICKMMAKWVPETTCDKPMAVPAVNGTHLTLYETLSI